MVMAQELYALLTPTPFCLPNNPGNTVVYVCPVVAGQPVDTTPLTRMEQAAINMQFTRAKHYFLSMHNIERACFTALDASINDTFKVSNDPTIQGWHASMRVIDILDQAYSSHPRDKQCRFLQPLLGCGHQQSPFPPN
jgi:hypothetical protein